MGGGAGGGGGRRRKTRLGEWEGAEGGGGGGAGRRGLENVVAVDLYTLYRSLVVAALGDRPVSLRLIFKAVLQMLLYGVHRNHKAY